jgi:hypothetical protein
LENFWAILEILACLGKLHMLIFFISAPKKLGRPKKIPVLEIFWHSENIFMLQKILGNLKTFLPNTFGQIMKVKKLLLSLPTIPGALS